jgi:excisionase family DNA binding protein
MAVELTTEEVAACQELAQAVLRFLAAYEEGKRKRMPPSTSVEPRPAWVPLMGSQKDRFEEAKLLLSIREAAKCIGTSERTLWKLTAPRGPIPAVRFGRVVRYSPDDLRAWIKQSRQEGQSK